MPPKKQNKGRKTREQGPEPCFEEYRCPKCKRQWRSATSCTDHGQQCRKCKINVFPSKPVPIGEKKFQGQKTREQYQGPEPCFGEYRCPKCKRLWMSAVSWIDYGQQCRKCKINVPAFKQRPLERSNHKIDNKEPHLQELCEKCCVLGRLCH